MKKTPQPPEKPLDQRCIVVTRSIRQSQSLVTPLQEAGVSIVYFPTMAIAPLTPPHPCAHIIAALREYDGILLTSRNAVEYFVQQLPPDLMTQWQQPGPRPALLCVGQSTAHALTPHGLTADHIAARATAADLLRELTQGDVRGKRFLFPCSLQARPTLPQGLQQAGAIVEKWPLYQPVCASTDPAPLTQQLRQGQIDLITVASPSAVRCLFQMIDPSLLRIPTLQWAAIGPTTAQSLREHGIDAPLVADPPGIPGLVSVILDHFSTGLRS